MTIAELGWSDKVRLPALWDLVTDPNAQVAFGKVVLANDLRRTHPAVADEAIAVGNHLRAKFEKQHGTIQNSFVCEHLLGGCALVARTTGTGRATRIERRLHAVLNSPVADLVTLETWCVTLADELNTALGRPTTRSTLVSASDVVYSAMTRVLVAADLFANPNATTDDRLAALAAAKRECADASTLVRATIQRQARFVYLQGVLIGAVLTIIAGGILGALAAQQWRHLMSAPALTAATIFGAVGAVVSVFQRIAAGQLILDYHTSRYQLMQLGALRPAVGATFGAVVQFALVGGLLGAANNGQAPDGAFGLFALIGFISGFSERFATDMIERAGRVISGSAAEPTAPATSASTEHAAAGDATRQGAGPTTTSIKAPPGGSVDASPQDRLGDGAVPPRPRATQA